MHVGIARPPSRRRLPQCRRNQNNRSQSTSIVTPGLARFDHRCRAETDYGFGDRQRLRQQRVNADCRNLAVTNRIG